MKYLVTRFKNLKIALKELGPYIRDGEYLQTGKPFKRFGKHLLREIWANWLLCTVINFEQKSDVALPCTDPQGGDGIIYNKVRKKGWPTEHILVPKSNEDMQEINSLILKAIKKKQNKGGAAYATGKILIVFLNIEGQWNLDTISRSLPQPQNFEEIWIIGLDLLQKTYSYNIARIYPNGCPRWQVRISENFETWEVDRISEV